MNVNSYTHVLFHHNNTVELARMQWIKMNEKFNRS